MVRSRRTRSSRRTRRKRTRSRKRRGGNAVLQAASVPLTLTVLNNMLKGKKITGFIGGRKRRRGGKSRKSRRRKRRSRRRR